MKHLSRIACARTLRHSRPRHLHSTPFRAIVKPFLLADIGEGIREVQIIQWFVQPGARVEQFDKLCEVQSDKASVEITSRFDGIIKKLHYDADDMAAVGKPLVDIDIQGEISEEVVALTEQPAEQSTETLNARETQQESRPDSSVAGDSKEDSASLASAPAARSDRHATLATPAVRHLTRELNVNIADVQGTGKDGRVLKEDVNRFVNQRRDESASLAQSAPTFSVPSGEDQTVSLSPIQHQMFKTMTKSLTIPHFLYSDSIDFTSLSKLRQSLKFGSNTKLSSLAFILKAVSLSFQSYPVLNARLNVTEERPRLVLRGDHNIGIAVDTPQGLLVPVIKRVQTLTIADIAAEILRLSSLGREGKLRSSDLSGGTFTVSNVGSIGGGVVSPVIVDGQTAIVGVGRARSIPGFDVDGNLVKREDCVFSWSADHRIVDGATVARCAENVKRLLEEPGKMLIGLR